MASWRQSSSTTQTGPCENIGVMAESMLFQFTVPSIGLVLKFFAHEIDKDKEYRSLNVYRSALSSVLTPVDGFPVGKYPLMTRAVKDVFQLRPCIKTQVY